MAELDWLDDKNEIYNSWAGTWSRQERLMRGGIYVRHELRRFDWETPPLNNNQTERVGGIATGNPMIPLARPGEHYESRQRQAVYFNFPDLFATVTVGHLMRHAPVPNFGQLGSIDRPEGATEPSDAELVYYNTDGVGNDGSQWANYWGTSMKRAMSTGHRWHFVEAPIIRPTTRADILAGRRPYMIELSPLRVPQWHYEAGQLQYAVVRVNPTRIRMTNGRLERAQKRDYLLLVRRGYADLGPEFASGGWWLFNGEDKAVMRNGNWDRTRGEIPMFPLYYERDSGVEEADLSTTGSYDDLNAALPAFSRPAMMDVANAAVSYYNLTSAVNFELWDGAKGLEWLRGVDRDSWELAMEKIREGSRWVPLRNNADTDSPPDVTARASNGPVISAFKERLEQIRIEVRELMSQEISGTPDSSGASKQAGFNEGKSPRLAALASELEQSQNTAIHFLELRFGHAQPSGAVTWPREFELVDFGEKLDEFLAAQATAGIMSPTATAKALATKAEHAGLFESEQERTTIEAEFVDAARTKQTSDQQLAAAAAAMAATAPTIPEDDGDEAVK